LRSRPIKREVKYEYRKNQKDGHKPPQTEAMPVNEIESLISRLESEMHDFVSIEGVDTDLTGKDRQRLISSRVRNNGFIDKAFDIAHDNPEFMPPHFDINILFENERRFEQLRQLMLVLQQFQQLATNAFMVQSDFCYREALRIYGSLREQARGRVPGAEQLFQALRNFLTAEGVQAKNRPSMNLKWISNGLYMEKRTAK